jgi:hypothetical protein
MLELLGVGLGRRDGSWLVRGVSARIDRSALILVTGGDADARRALLDAIAGEVVPVEGRVWVGGVPVTLTSRRRVRRLVHDVDLQTERHDRRGGDPAHRPPTATRIAAEVGDALARASEFLLLREVDANGDTRGMDGVAGHLALMASMHRLTVIASAAHPGPFAKHAHMTIALAPEAARVVVA